MEMAVGVVMVAEVLSWAWGGLVSTATVLTALQTQAVLALLGGNAMLGQKEVRLQVSGVNAGHCSVGEGAID